VPGQPWEQGRRLDKSLEAILAFAPEKRPGNRLRKRYAKLCRLVFTFLDHPEAAPGNNGSECGLRTTATYRKVTGGFRSDWGADLFVAIRSIIGTAPRHGIDAHQAILTTLRGQSILTPD
jgi:transposase